ncbi:SMP-30/gluconolactonase/LRE family protein [Ancylobacter pratisalsi]|uniref:SMP-30/gluconolactonase/LRE family protein n=1 Tax=Ancylobacter pratisalsi TaxID=1745854 RepID=A0A6P1YMC3_9HYPH|nr:SMP-30/gluconolactonase/LRE family protein [Ancylobacter pratisalsi]QIB34587.1 SMP-30/gluconolactonase/LRE family protein [Ancylobacter pratisalsi]
MSYFEVVDRRFTSFIIPVCQLETLHTGTRWAEGPVYFADGRFLVFSDIPNDRMLRWDEETGAVANFRFPANHANGNTRDRDGRLVTCEHGARRITRTEHDGRITVLVDAVEGKRLNSPNDVVVKSDGTLWFTDPPYGILTDYEGNKADSEIGRCNVYRLDPADGRVTMVADDFDKPNGLAFSPDEKWLYIADSGRSHGAHLPHHIRRFSVGEDGTLAGGDVFASIDPGVPDGIRVDTEGHLWVSAGDGVHCYAPDGDLLGKILIPETVANITFGGPKRNRLFIAATTSLYAVYLNARGAQTP